MRDDVLRKRMGAAAREASERYSVERVMARWVELFECVVKE